MDDPDVRGLQDPRCRAAYDIVMAELFAQFLTHLDQTCFRLLYPVGMFLCCHIGGECILQLLQLAVYGDDVLVHFGCPVVHLFDLHRKRRQMAFDIREIGSRN